MLYKGIVKDKITKKTDIGMLECDNKKSFIKNFRMNGYSVDVKRVKKAEVFDAIIDYTDCEDFTWLACKTVEDAKNYKKVVDDYLDKKIEKLDKKIEKRKEKEEQTTVETEEEKEMTTYKGLTKGKETKQKTGNMQVDAESEKNLLGFLGCKDNEELLYKFKNSDAKEISELKQVFEMIAEDRVIDNEIRLKDKKSLIDFLKFKAGFKEREEFIVIFLNNYNIMTGYETLFTGTIDKSAIYPREIVERVFKYKAKGIIFAHNHPSGNLRPSRKDIEITEHMQEFLDMIDVKLLEHIIITKDGYFSFLEEGLI